MNQTLPTADLNTAGTTDVIPSVAIDRIIAQRNEGMHCSCRRWNAWRQRAGFCSMLPVTFFSTV
ncbi:hypothetical protein MU524_26135 (plasmid) [Escherichia coli]|nr:hypothetical protein MU524_26135 [Escherichia coli]